MRDARPPWASKFFRFHAVFGKIWRVHAPPGGFTPPPRENPGSATANHGKAILAAPLDLITLGSAVLLRTLAGSGCTNTTSGRSGPNHNLNILLCLVVNSTSHCRPFSPRPGCYKTNMTKDTNCLKDLSSSDSTGFPLFWTDKIPLYFHDFSRFFSKFPGIFFIIFKV